MELNVALKTHLRSRVNYLMLSSALAQPAGTEHNTAVTIAVPLQETGVRPCRAMSAKTDWFLRAPHQPQVSV